MVLVAWIVVVGWLGLFLASARHTTKTLPMPVHDVPQYILWLPHGGVAPALEPPPWRIHTRPTMPNESMFILCLGADVSVPADLVGRLSACSSDFVSVLPHPKNSWLSCARERLIRDVAGPQNVNDIFHPAGYADERCTWFHRSDADQPGWGSNVVSQVARSRKSHGLCVDLRAGGGLGQVEGSVRATESLSADAFKARLHDFTVAEPLLAPIVGSILVVLNAWPWLGLFFPETRWLSVLAIGLGVATRINTALREGFGWNLWLLGWVCDLAFGARWFFFRPHIRHAPLSEVPDSPPPDLTSAQARNRFKWLEYSSVLRLARRLGGSSLVMEQIYENSPAGANATGRLIDRIALSSDAARAVRWRSETVSKWVCLYGGDCVLSFPCGTARDLTRCSATNIYLVDPDSDARRIASHRLPHAVVLDGTIDDVPNGPFEGIVYIGLAEYLTELELLRHIDCLKSRLAPDGTLIISTTDEHPQKQFMTKMLGWSTRTRSVDVLVDLLDTGGFRIEKKQSDPWGIQWVIAAQHRR